MNKELFLNIVSKLGDQDLEDFVYEQEGCTYYFAVQDDKWDDQGKYQYKNESGQLIQRDSKGNDTELLFGVSRSVQRSGSYFSDYYYSYEDYESYEIKEVVVPEVIIPEHKELKWEQITSS